jgi:hypothetical protein
MAGRYTGWHHTIGDAHASPSYVAVGKKLLGYLDQQRKLSGVKTCSIERTLPDGSVVRARFEYDIPVIEVRAGGGQQFVESCRLYMESGVLDLGENTAASWTDQITVADAAPSFGFDGVASCDDTPLQGQLQINTAGNVFGQCIAKKDPVPVPRACDPVMDGSDWECTRLEKLTAQARLQPSVWTGLMRRWVQAQYGTPEVKYRVAGPEWEHLLEVPAIAADGSATTLQLDYRWPATWLIVDPGQHYTYFFVEATASELRFHRTTLRTPCAAMLRELLRHSGGSPLRARLESYLLSQVVPMADIAFTVAFDTPVVGVPLAYGWQANARGDEIAIVAYDQSGKTMQLYRRAIARSTDGIAVTEADEAATSYEDVYDTPMPGAIIGPTRDNRTMRQAGGHFEDDAFLGLGAGTDGVSWDAPVYAYYIADDAGDANILEVVRSKVLPGISTVEADDHCWQADFPQVTAVDDAPCAFTDQRRPQTSVARGFYTARYSSVRLNVMGIGTIGTRKFLDAFGGDVAVEEIQDIVRSDTTESQLFDAPTDPIPTSPGPGPNLSDVDAYTTLAPYTSADGACSVSQGVGNAATAPSIDGPADCPDATTGFHIGGSEMHNTQTVDVTRTTISYSARSYNQFWDDGKPTVLIIPAGSATGVYFREYDGHRSTLQVTEYAPASFVAREQVKTSGTSFMRCFYQSDDLESGYTSDVAWEFDAGSFGDYVTKSFTVGGMPPTVAKSQTQISGTEAARTYWLGYRTPTTITPEQQAMGTIYSLSGDVGVVSAAPTPGCYAVDFTDPAAGVNSPLLAYSFGPTADKGFFDFVNGFSDSFGGPVMVRTSASGLELKYPDMLYMSTTFPAAQRDTAPGYAAFPGVPSFIGAV